MALPRVFIVDDDPAILDSLKLLLEQNGYPITSFHTGEEFFQAISPDTAGIVILDVKMPGIDGLQVLELLRNRKYHLKVIMITGHADIPMTVRAIKTGAVEFLEKPFYPETLMQAIEDAATVIYASQDSEMGQLPEIDRFSTLNLRERVILNGIVRGLSNKELAECLDVSLRTIQFGRSRMFKKIGFQNRTELMEWVVANNIDLKYFHADSV